MNKDNPTTACAAAKKPVEAAKDNPVARFLAMANIVAKKEAPVACGAAIVMSIIAILVSIKFISVEFMVILVLGTLIKYSFQAGVVWQRLRSGKGRT